jgi:hypothetical protein
VDQVQHLVQRTPLAAQAAVAQVDHLVHLMQVVQVVQTQDQVAVESTVEVIHQVQVVQALLFLNTQILVRLLSVQVLQDQPQHLAVDLKLRQ